MSARRCGQPDPLPVRSSVLLALLVGSCLVTARTAVAQTVAHTVPATLSFNQHVRPILANHCWSCHGRDEAGRQGSLRLDLRSAALLAGDSGRTAIVPGRTHDSEVVRRIHSTDPQMVMPPPEAQRPLTAVQQQILEKWIEQGAEYEEHWAFLPPVRPAIPSIPAISGQPTLLHPIDAFVLQRLQAEQLTISPPVAPGLWLRRVTLDLTGLPPSPEEQLDFAQDVQNRSLPEARERVVDRLLSSTRYAERMAMHWLDLARYADTNGYNNDEVRTMWPWRDWVIRAFAEGMPYDQFLTEQLAGDLLPNPTLSQKVATGFNRNHVLTTEGGIIEEEYHWEYVADRIHTTSTVFMGLSMQCARCHDHKYDPLSQRDYYQLAAFFNNVPDRIVSYSQGRMAEPLLPVPSEAQQAELDQLSQRQQQLEALLAERVRQSDADRAAWEDSLTDADFQQAELPGLVNHFALDESEGDFHDRRQPAVTAVPHGPRETVAGRHAAGLKFAGETWLAAQAVGDFEADQAFTTAAWIQLTTRQSATVLSRMDESRGFRGYDVILEDAKVAAHFISHWPDQAIKVICEQPLSLQEWHHVVVTWDGSRKSAGVQIFVDGQRQTLQVTTDNPFAGSLRTDQPFHVGRRQHSAPFSGVIDDVQVFDRAISEADITRLHAGGLSSQLRALVQIPAGERTDAETQQLRDYYIDQVDAVSRQYRMELAELPKRREAVEKAIPVTMVMQEQAERRPSYLLKRGQYDQRGEQVRAGIPAVLASSMAQSSLAGQGDAATTELTRLDLARWLTSPENPLTARVAVNRWWELLFGVGLVETSEDFGIQGALPTHPELLDWLACELRESGWDQRALLKQIVLSETYAQTSTVTPALQERDPRNQWLARGARYRLPAETLRDCALAVSGLLKEQVGGPSVRPYQPEGLWEDVSVERRDKYVPDAGDGLYRRSMYTFWKRTCPPPSMTTFDAPDRETCVVRRSRTNTPLQALVLMNDPAWLEAARKLAERVLLGAETESDRWDLAFRLVLSRPSDVAEVAVLVQVREAAREHFREHPGAAHELLKIGNSAAAESLPAEELAAWSAAMSVLLNLDEALSRP